jgi:hypothetical protein
MSAAIADPLERKLSNAPIDASPFLRMLQLVICTFGADSLLTPVDSKIVEINGLEETSGVRLNFDFSPMVPTG